MRVRCLLSVNLVFGGIFSELYKFLCHVSQIVSICGELRGPGVWKPTIYVLHSDEMGMVFVA
jgi:hypothetical protein